MLSLFSRLWLFATLWTIAPLMLFCPWDSPGKNTGVDCHALLQGIFLTQGSNPHLMSPALAGRFYTTRATWEAQERGITLVAQSCPTLCNPMDCSLPVSFVHGISQARIVERVAISFSRGSSRPRDRTRLSCILGKRFTVWAPGKPKREGRSKQTCIGYLLCALSTLYLLDSSHESLQVDTNTLNL